MANPYPQAPAVAGLAGLPVAADWPQRRSDRGAGVLDARAGTTYVGRVTLLLLLSALLSALSGAGEGARAPQAAVAVARVVAAATESGVRAGAAGLRPVLPAPRAAARIAGTPMRLPLQAGEGQGERRRE